MRRSTPGRPTPATGSGASLGIGSLPILSETGEHACEVRKARPEDAPEITRIAFEIVSWSRLYKLGTRFANLLHGHMATSEHSVMSVGLVDGELSGFMVGATDTSKFFRQFLVRHGVKASLVLLPQLFVPRNFAPIWRGLTYFPEMPEDDPKAEILAIAVLPSAQRTGIGGAMFRDVIRRFDDLGTARLKFGVIDVQNELSNSFFQKKGADFLRSEEFYPGKFVNVYACDIPAMRATFKDE